MWSQSVELMRCPWCWNDNALFSMQWNFLFYENVLRRMHDENKSSSTARAEYKMCLTSTPALPRPVAFRVFQAPKLWTWKCFCLTRLPVEILTDYNFLSFYLLFFHSCLVCLNSVCIAINCIFIYDRLLWLFRAFISLHGALLCQSVKILYKNFT